MGSIKSRIVECEKTDQDFSPENRLKRAAISAFVNKGFYGATTGDITDKASVNTASLNYYFRSKERLFEILYKEQLQAFKGTFTSIVKSAKPLREKIIELVNDRFDLLINNIEGAAMLLHESAKHPALFNEIIDSFDLSALDELNSSYKIVLKRVKQH